MQLDSLMWETASPRTHKPKIVNESLIHRCLVQKNLLQNDNYENLDNVSDISFDIFKELSGVIFSVHFILPKVADCYSKDRLHRFY